MSGIIGADMASKAKRIPGTYERVSVAELFEDPENARYHPVEEIAGIAWSIGEFGVQRPVLAEVTGRVIAGNGTLRAAIAAGKREIDVRWSELQGSKADDYALVDNRLAELASWDLSVFRRSARSFDDVGAKHLNLAPLMHDLGDLRGPLDGAGPLVEPAATERVTVRVLDVSRRADVVAAVTRGIADLVAAGVCELA